MPELAGPGWTASAPLPGGDFPLDGQPALVADLMARHPFFRPECADRLVKAYGTLAAEIVVIAFVVILVTLVVQGLTLPPLVRRLRLPKEILHEREEAHARAHAVTAALERLDRATGGGGFPVEVVGRLRDVYTERLQRLRRADGTDRSQGEEEAALRRLRAELLLAERRALVELRDREVISDEVLSRLEHELNLEAMRAGLGEALGRPATTPRPR